VPLLRTPSFLAAVLLLTPVVAQAAPVSKKPPPGPLSSQGSPAPAAKPARALPAGKAAPAGLHNASHGSTAKLASAAAPQRAMPSKSIGSPTDGHLVNGVHLADAPYLRIYPVYTGSDVRWGTDTLVGLVDRAARSVHKQFPDAVLSVGQLSKNGGGEVDRHASHESGRDADVGFYVKSSLGKPILADHMVAFLGDGTAPSWPGAHFDDARNWALVSSIVGDPHAKVTHLFVATPIRERLLAYAAKIGASPAIRSKAAEVLAQPHGSLPHDDHFHVRIACPAGQDGKCIEQPLAHHGHGAAMASHGHPAHPSHGATSPTSANGPTATASMTAAPAAPHAAPASGHAAPAAPPKAPSRSETRDESAKGEASIPSLAPSIPGLDSAVIPAPLTGVKSTWGVEKDLPPPAKADAANGANAISDPDGVLEHN
jgi:penicillin-insensitive murein endopeptidase